MIEYRNRNLLRKRNCALFCYFFQLIFCYFSAANFLLFISAEIHAFVFISRSTDEIERCGKRSCSSLSGPPCDRIEKSKFADKKKLRFFSVIFLLIFSRKKKYAIFYISVYR